jgi:hypothetical protein
VAACVVVAQIVSVPTALLVGLRADSWGRKPLLLAAFAALPLRGILYSIGLPALSLPRFPTLMPQARW